MPAQLKQALEHALEGKAVSGSPVKEDEFLSFEDLVPVKLEAAEKACFTGKLKETPKRPCLF